MSEKSFIQELWDHFSTLDVEGIAELKGTLDYVSWSNCVTDIKQKYPGSNFTRLEDEVLANGTVTVIGAWTYRDGDREWIATPMWLPVMDNRNNSIVDPTSRQLSDAAQRLLVKAAAVDVGYGLSLWRGTVLGTVTEEVHQSISPQQAEEIKSLLKASGRNLDKFLGAAEAASIEAIDEHKYAWLVGLLKKAIEAK